MRVLHVYRTYLPDTQGGLEETIRQICANTLIHGVESRIFSLSRQPQPSVIIRPEGEVHRFPLSFEIASCGFTGSGVVGFTRLVEWADVIHYHFPWPFADLLHLFGRVKKPSLVTYHSDIIRQKQLLKLYRPLMYRFLSKVNRIVATSPNYFVTSETLKEFANKVDIIPIGIERESYPSAQASALESVREQVGEDFFLFVGVLRYYKGLHVLLDASLNADFKVVIVGAGPVEQELKHQANKLGLKNVVFLGFVSDEVKVSLFQLARAVVFPSYMRSEAFGVTLVEGAMFGKPLISAEIGSGMSYINKDGETGLVVTPGDPRSLREAMDRLHRDKDAAAMMGCAALERYEQLFTGRRMGEMYARLYADLIEC